MKTQFKFLAVLLIIPLFFLACSKDDDPADNDLFVGTYNGTISYNNGSTSISTGTGKVTVVKTGNNYNFKFSDGIPDLNGVEFQRNENEVISIGSDESKYIRITAGSLNITFAKDGAIWTADCSR
jgi:thioredoxin-related protein